MDLQFTLRPAAEADQPAIKALIRQAGINPLGLQWPRFLVAVDGEKCVIGCGQVKTHGDGSRELASLAVARGWRGRGVAAELITALQALYGAPLWLTCIDRLVPFYERFGFVRVEAAREMPAYFRRASRFFNLYLALRRDEARLAVMVWSGEHQ